MTDTIDEKPSSAPTTIDVSAKDRRRALMGSAVGSTIEWYDYFLYGTMATAIFNLHFFPSEDPVVSSMLAFASFALAFVVRPLGGVIFSHVGDRIGRKKTLVITLTLMGVATMLMGVLPDYAAIGVAAPILLTLLRLVQGLALGGEWGGGLLLAVEYAPKNKRGFYGSVPQIGALAGLALGNIVTIASRAVFPEEQFESFGWRIPFLLSGVLLVVGLWIRARIDETPSFRKVQAEGTKQKLPIATVLKHYWREVLISTGAKFVETSTFFIFATFSLSYATGLGYDFGAILGFVLVGSIIGIGGMLFFGGLSDRIGRKKVFLGGSVAVAIFIFPYLAMLSSGNLWLAGTALIVSFAIVWPIYGSLIGTVLAENFAPEIRYTGASLGYQIGAALVGGPAPLIATALLAGFGGSWIPVALFVVACALVSFIAVSFVKVRHNEELDV
ncbi:MFS transporter [Microbacterium sp. MEC084]|uniref:MFS transporter n=1 Tax=Microbacterium sp. MEC084 TaxID=1963027 RepID=UPI00106F4129|nr:MFS transporter [Microbacterium sp. MEC084]MCD1267408.1 MFS transporter [Microbacterium sp. MEC084]